MQKLLRYALCWGGVILFYKANGQQRDTIGKVPLLPKDSTGVMVGKKQLKEVVVTGQKARVIEYQLDRIVLNANALVTTAGGNVIDVLNTAPGVLIDEN